MSTEINLDAMLEKVKKLMALAGNNPSEEEAKAAMMKANALIAKYNLDMNQDAEVKIEYAMVAATHSNNEGYRTHLGTVLAESFRCKCFMVGNVVNFFGHKQDAEACVEVFNYVYRVSHNIGLKLERQARKAGENTHGVANSYWRGFVSGIQDALGEQCKALAVVVPQDVKEEAQRRYKVDPNKHYRGGMRSTGYDSTAYHKGVDDGRHTMKSKREIEG